MSCLQFEFPQKMIHQKNISFKSQTFRKSSFRLFYCHQQAALSQKALVSIATTAKLDNTLSVCQPTFARLAAFRRMACQSAFAFPFRSANRDGRQIDKSLCNQHFEVVQSRASFAPKTCKQVGRHFGLGAKNLYEKFALENQQVSFSDENFKLKKKKIQKKLLNGYSKIHELKLVTIGLASPEKIQSWAEKELPNGKIFGEVTNANTFHYRTFKPSKGGLFCERIFGPLKDFECACGKRKKPTAIESKKILEHEQTSRSFCPNCDVEYTWSILRRYQLGYIKLNAPVTHLWYFKTNPSYLSILFDMKRKDLESIIYCTQTITIENTWKYSEQNSSLTRSPTDLYLKWQKFFTIEEKTKEHQMIFQNKKAKLRQKKEKNRNVFFTKKSFQKQTNWQNFETQNFLTSLKNSESVLSSSSFEQSKNLPLSLFSPVQQKQIDIFINIYKQKQKKFISFAIQEIWKKFLQKSYQKSLIFHTSIELFFENSLKNDNQLTTHKQLQKILQNFSLFFFFSSLIPESVDSKIRSFDFQQKTAGTNFSYEATRAYSPEPGPLPGQSLGQQGADEVQMNAELLGAQHSEVVQGSANKASSAQYKSVKSTSIPKKYKRLFFKNEKSIFHDFLFFKKTNNVSDDSSFDFFIENQYSNKEMSENSKILKKEKIYKKKFWKSFFFLLEFSIYFLQQKKKKRKNVSKFSKKDILFFFNLLPFLKKYKIFQNTKFVDKDLTKIQFFLQKSVQKSLYQIHSNFENKSGSHENIQLEMKKIFVERKSFVSKRNTSFAQKRFHFDNTLDFDYKKKNFDQNKKSSMTDNKMTSPQLFSKNINFFFLKEKIDFLQAKQKDNNISFLEIFTISIHFEKILCVLKTYYEIDFCSLFYNSIFFSAFPEKTNEMKKLSDVNKNLLSQKSFDIKNWHMIFEQGVEIFVQESQIYSVIEKVSFEYFTFLLYLFKSNFLFSNFSHGQLVLENSKNEKENIHFYIESLKAQNSLFILLNSISFGFFSKNQTKIKKTPEILNVSLSRPFPLPRPQRGWGQGWGQEYAASIDQAADFSEFHKLSDELLNQATIPQRKFNNFDFPIGLDQKKTKRQESSFENNRLQIEKKVSLKNTKKPDMAETISIYNKQLTSKVKFSLRKKQTELNKFTKFFHLSSTVPSSKQNLKSQQNSFSVDNKKNLQTAKGKVLAKTELQLAWARGFPRLWHPAPGQKPESQFGKKIQIQKIYKNEQNPIKKKQKKANFAHFAGASSITDSNTAHLSVSLLGWQSNNLSEWKKKNQKVTIKTSPPKTNMNLKNKVLTIAYNYVWNNDANWKYFVYYNSLFLNEFEDIPIFIYGSTSSFSEKPRKSTKIQKEAYLTPKKTNESFLPFFDFDVSTKNFLVGAGILEKLLTEYTSVELRKMTIQHQILLPKIQQTLRFLKQTAKTKKDSLKIQKYFQKREHIIRRLKFLRKFSRRNSNPNFMILRNLPVLPPDLRPILKLQNQIAASDLNRFYQRIIYRNERFKKFAKDSATNQSFEIKYAQRLLQEAVDNLIQNGKGSVKAETNSRGQPLKSLSEILKGKQGRFRQYLLGKRVDYSGRSVIVVGPELKLYECGIPKEMALELFLPFLIQYILKYKLAQTVIGAKNLLKSDSTLTIHLLQKVMKNVPVLLNRAPTLHRLGFQAFLPKLIDGRAILLHPMVCPAFNADFDGDQMAVHIPLTVEARTEAWKFMLSINNFINSATGEPVLLPSQDMVLGCYFLTNDFLAKFVGIQFSNFLKKQNDFLKKKESFSSTKLNFYNFIIQNKSFLFFQNFNSVITAYQRKEIFIHTPIWMKVNGPVDFGNDSSKPVEIRLQLNGIREKIHPKYTIIYDRQNTILDKYIRTTVGRILMNLMIQECIHS